MLHDLVANPGDHSGPELYDAMVAELAAGVGGAQGASRALDQRLRSVGPRRE